MNQNRVWTSMCRAFVKGVAIHTGLGFSLWLKEEMSPKFDDEPINDRLADDTQIKLIERYGKDFHLNINKWLEANEATWESLTELQAAKMLVTLHENYGDLTPEGK